MELEQTFIPVEAEMQKNVFFLKLLLRAHHVQ